MFDNWLVISDMDGTLLNHYDYRVKAALPMLEKLESAFIPVIFNTSKTFSELKDWVDLLNNKHPFIVENGSAIYIPEDYFSEKFKTEFLSDARIESGYRVLLTGIDILLIAEYVKKIKPDAIDLTRCGLQQAMDITGLNKAEAMAAQNRQFSVPLMFQDDAKQQAFAEQAKHDGFGILKGGRFLHILGLCDKGSSMHILKKLYELQYQKTYGLIVLGDSPNDLAMLEQADSPVIVKSPSSHSIVIDHQAVFYSKREAPEGWVEGIDFALANIKFNGSV